MRKPVYTNMTVIQGIYRHEKSDFFFTSTEVVKTKMMFSCAVITQMIHSLFPHGEFNILLMSLCVRKPTIWVPTWSDTNRAIQAQKMARDWKFLISMKMRHCTFRLQIVILQIAYAKTKTQISCAVSAQLICTFDFAYAICWFSDAVAQIFQILLILNHRS